MFSGICMLPGMSQWLGGRWIRSRHILSRRGLGGGRLSWSRITGRVVGSIYLNYHLLVCFPRSIWECFSDRGADWRFFLLIGITVVLKEQVTRDRIAKEKEEKRLRKKPWEQLPSRPLVGQTQYYRW